MFRNLEFWTWRQFQDVKIRFHDRLTVLTGANGAGKTTILNLLSQHFGWSFPLVSEPTLDRKGALRYFSGADESHELLGDRRVIGRLTYGTGHQSAISVPVDVKASHEARFDSREPLSGIYLPSHRPVYSYQEVTEIPTRVDATRELFEQYLTNLRSFWVSNSRTESPSLRLKRALISLATFGYGNEAVEPNLQAKEAFEGFQRILKVMMPSHLGFLRLRVRTPEVVLETARGTFSVDGSSGGVAALIDLAWQTYMQSITEEQGPFIVLADEPENHLHPALQREVMPKLLEAFPTTQFVVATHNPFVVNSVRDSFVYALRFEDDINVRADQLDMSDKAGTANDVLREVLGVPVPLPLWVEQEVGRLLESVDPTDVSAATIRQLRDGLNELGAGRQFALVLDQLLESDAQTDED